MRCHYCSSEQGRCAITSSGRSITECTCCGRVVEERQTLPHHLFHIRAQDSPLCLATSDLPPVPTAPQNSDEDPFEPTGFITAFSTWSLEPYPVFAHSSLSFSGHLAELERVLETTSSTVNPSGPSVVVDNLRAYLQIIDVASILELDCDITDHAFQLFRDCSSATCLRNRSVEALATAALVQAIREAQEPRTLQEISIAANLPQKEIGKYIKILGEALQLSQPINSNSISVHMPRFCTLLQLNKSAQELATNIGEVVINKCFCTRRNPISISAAAIYLACQLEDNRKTQAEICKVTGLTEVTLRKVYKELLENWDDLLPSNYNPVVPPEKAFPTASISAGRSSSKADIVEAVLLNKDKHAKPIEILNASHQNKGKENAEKDNFHRAYNTAILGTPSFWKPQVPSGNSSVHKPPDTKQTSTQNMEIDLQYKTREEKKVDTDAKSASSSSTIPVQFPMPTSLCTGILPWPFRPPVTSSGSPSVQIVQPTKTSHGCEDLFGPSNAVNTSASADFFPTEEEEEVLLEVEELVQKEVMSEQAASSKIVEEVIEKAVEKEIERAYNAIFLQEPPDLETADKALEIVVSADVAHETVVQPEPSVVIQNSLLISEEAIQKSTSPSKEQSLDFLFQNPEDPTDSETGKQSANDKGKGLVLRTDFKSPAPDESIPTEMKLNDILSKISHVSRTMSQIKNDNLSIFLSIDQIRRSLIGSLKSVGDDVHSLMFSLDSLNKKFAFNLVNSQEALSKKIELLQSSFSKRFDFVEDRLTDISSHMNSFPSMLSKISDDKIDKKREMGGTEESNKKRTKPSYKRTGKGPDPKKHKS